MLVGLWLHIYANTVEKICSCNVFNFLTIISLGLFGVLQHSLQSQGLS